MENATVCAVATIESCCNSEQCVNTDSEGRFVFPEHQTTAATLMASASGYVTGAEEIAADAERAERGQEIRLEVDPGGVSLLGAVYDLYGGPIAGAVVRVTHDLEEERGPFTLSGTDGSFSLTARRGESLLCAHAEVYSRVCNTVLAPSVGNTLVLMPQSTIVGRVVTAKATEAVAHATVRASNSDGLRVPTRTTHSLPDGSFVLDALPAGRYAVAAVSEHGRSATVWVSVGVDETSGSVTLATSPAIRLHASVLLGDRPCPHAELDLSGPIQAFERLSSDGTIDIDGLLPGAYQAVAFCSGVPKATQLDIADGPIHHEWTFQQAPRPADPDSSAADPNERALAAHGGTIKVTVNDLRGTAEPIRVFANARSPVPLQARQIGAEFIFDDLPNGEYRVHPFDDLEQARSVRIHQPGEVVEVQVTLRERGAITGRVLDDSGTPVSQGWIKYSRIDLPDSDRTLDPPVLTDDDGAFTLSVTTGARYSIVASSPAGDGRIEAIRSGQRTEIRLDSPVALAAPQNHALEQR